MELFQSDMSSELKRYATFNGFETPPGVWPLHLAQAGFYRSVDSDREVICFACGLRADVGAFGKEDVMGVHRHMSPNCRFVAGSADNQPVPAVDPQAALEWLHQNFNFDGIQDVEFQNLPVIQDSVSSTGDRVTSTPALTNSFARGESDSLPVLPLMLSDLNTLEQPGLPTQNPDLSSLPSDLLYGLENAALTSVPAATLFQAGHLSQTSQLFTSTLSSNLGGPGEILVADGEPLEPVGEYPQTVLHELEMSNSKNMPQQPMQIQELGESGTKPQPLTYGALGIIVQQPKREEYTTYQKRLRTFERWMGQPISQSKEAIAEAGFYYAGYADCCRCFYCGGGLKSWESGDHPWVEHARWFKDCPFVLTNKGKGFVEAVQSLAHTNNKVRMEDVIAEMIHLGYSVPSDLLDELTETLTNDVDEDMGLPENVDAVENELKSLHEENENLRRPEMCKICQDAEVSIVYLPCGHLVTCGLCSSTVKTCPICRQTIRGKIRVERTN